MQRERSALDSFPEPIDLNQGSNPSNTSTMDHSSSWDNMLSPVENRRSTYMLGPTDGNVSRTNTSSDVSHNFTRWDHGESSSGPSNAHDRDDSKIDLGCSLFFDSCPDPDLTSENWSFDLPSNISTTSRGTPSTHNYISNHGAALSLDSNNRPHSPYKSGHSEIEQIPTYFTSSSNLGAFPGSSNAASVDNNDASGSSFATWGLSCKRKALECTSGQFYPPGGSSSSNQPMDKNVIQHPFPDCYTSRGNLRISTSSGPIDSSPTNFLEQMNPSSGAGVSMSRRTTPDLFPSPISGLSESPTGNITSRSSHGQNGSILFGNPRSTPSRNFGVYSSESRPSTTIATNPNSTSNRSRLMHLHEARGGMHPYTLNGSFGSRGASSSGPREEVGNVRTSGRNNYNNNNNNLEYPLNSSVPETRNAMQDQIDWSFVPGNSMSSRNQSLGSRAGPSSSSIRASLASWLPHQNPSALQNHQRLSEIASWVPFHRGESESGIQRSHFANLPSSSSSSSDEAGPSNRTQRQWDQRSAGFLMDLPGDDGNGWRSLAAVEDRHRLIRQVLTAVRRGVHSQPEEYILDPYGFAELHDSHMDMRLDVDDMSYEELLALEERIGNVSTGLSDERIRGSMKQRKFEKMDLLSNLEPCCVCQENYMNEDDVGILDCGHEFHTGCIKHWLTLKNLCPICKMTALKT